MNDVLIYFCISRALLLLSSQVMPYLSRRAIENKSVLGNGAAQGERRRAAAEIVARIFG